jgi:hypothetical protein
VISLSKNRKVNKSIAIKRLSLRNSSPIPLWPLWQKNIGGLSSSAVN